jgi:hypothetical protein
MNDEGLLLDRAAAACHLQMTILREYECEANLSRDDLSEISPHYSSQVGGCSLNH